MITECRNCNEEFYSEEPPYDGDPLCEECRNECKVYDFVSMTKGSLSLTAVMDLNGSIHGTNVLTIIKILLDGLERQKLQDIIYHIERRYAE